MFSRPLAWIHFLKGGVGFCVFCFVFCFVLFCLFFVFFCFSVRRALNMLDERQINKTGEAYK